MNSAANQAPTASAIETFTQTFGHSPRYIVTSPGRVNLIGEHTDYNLLPVLPMPIDRAITIHLTPRADSIARFANNDSTYPAFEVDLEQPITPNPGHWGNYCLAALDYITRHLHTSGPPTVRGFDALITSTLPPAAGLSSSSALVIATCLALLQSNNIQWTPTEIAEHMRLAEHFVGTAGGGMDQAAIALGQPDSALLIEFDPLQSYPVPIPDDIAIFIINSGQKAEKSGAARYNYNRRALECAIGAQLLMQHLGSSPGNTDSTSSTNSSKSSQLANVKDPSAPKPLTKSILDQRPAGSAGIPAGPNANSTTSPETSVTSLAQHASTTSPVTTSTNAPNQLATLRDIYNITSSNPAYRSHWSYRSYQNSTSNPTHATTASTNPLSPAAATPSPLSTVHSQLSTVHPQPSTVHSQPSTVHSQPSTVHSQLSTPPPPLNSQLSTLNSPPPSSAQAPTSLGVLLPPDPLTPDQVKSLITPEIFAQLCHSKKLDPDAITDWLPGNLLQIYARAAHVLNEADRVYALRDAFARNDRSAAFHISNAGHASCRDLYHISTPEIEQLIQTTLAAGAGSARITGAGFGGCIVALVPKENAQTFPQNLQAAGIQKENIIQAKSHGPARIQPLS